jgi:hypothetical protein
MSGNTRKDYQSWLANQAATSSRFAGQRLISRQNGRVEISQLAQALVALGCPAEKSADMAAQLDKRARQLAAEKGRSYEEAMRHLLTLMKQGWAAPK